VWLDELLWLLHRLRTRRRVWWRIEETIEPLTGDETF
jgi:hypothetical protein